MNVFCIVGQIERLPVLKETSTGLKTCEVELKVIRPFSNSEGEFENDYITTISREVWVELSETIGKVAEVGAGISVKGRIATRVIQKSEKTYRFYTFIAENVGFIQAFKK